MKIYIEKHPTKALRFHKPVTYNRINRQKGLLRFFGYVFVIRASMYLTLALLNSEPG